MPGWRQAPAKRFFGDKSVHGGQGKMVAEKHTRTGRFAAKKGRQPPTEERQDVTPRCETISEDCPGRYRLHLPSALYPRRTRPLRGAEAASHAATCGPWLHRLGPGAFSMRFSSTIRLTEATRIFLETGSLKPILGLAKRHAFWRSRRPWSCVSPAIRCATYPGR